MEEKKNSPFSLGPEHRLVHRASWHEDRELNQKQGAILAKDYQATKARLIRSAVAAHLKRDLGPNDLRAAAHNLKARKIEETGLRILLWKRTPIACYTDPCSRVKGFVYSLIWHWKQLV